MGFIDRRGSTFVYSLLVELKTETLEVRSHLLNPTASCLARQRYMVTIQEAGVITKREWGWSTLHNFISRKMRHLATYEVQYEVYYYLMGANFENVLLRRFRTNQYCRRTHLNKAKGLGAIVYNPPR